MSPTRREFLATSAAAAVAAALGHPRFALAWQGQAAQPVFTPLRRNTGLFTMRGGTIGWLASPGGVVVIDSQFPAEAKACLEGLNTRSGNRAVDLLVNTHHHGDHTGGNVTFRGVAKKVVAHAKADEHMRRPPAAPAAGAQAAGGQAAGGQAATGRAAGSQAAGTQAAGTQAAGAQAAGAQAGGRAGGQAGAQANAQASAQAQVDQLFPDTTFTETWSADVGDERVMARHYGRAHTSGDIVVTFERANVAHMGDLMFNQRHPVVDRSAGASMRGWTTVLERAMRDHTSDTIYIFGHANMGLPVSGSAADVTRFRDYLVALLGFVESQVKAGKSREEILAMREPLKGFESFGRFGAPGPRDPLTVAYEEITTGV